MCATVPCLLPANIPDRVTAIKATLTNPEVVQATILDLGIAVTLSVLPTAAYAAKLQRVLVG